MKNIIIVILLLIIGALAYVMTKGSVAPSDDARTNVVLTNDERNLILGEMRQFLISLQGVSSAITAKDLKKVEEIAHKAGMLHDKRYNCSLAHLTAYVILMGFSPL